MYIPQYLLHDAEYGPGSFNSSAIFAMSEPAEQLSNVGNIECVPAREMTFFDSTEPGMMKAV